VSASWVPGHGWSPKLKDWICDNVPLGQGCPTPHGEMMNEYGAVMELQLTPHTEETQRGAWRSDTSSTTNHMKSSRTEQESSRWEASVFPP
jgi:hypothetical protein